VTEAPFPDKLDFLFEKHRAKIAYGGRAGMKSWGFARALLILGAERTLRIPCCRETQKSIADSVHKLLCDQIDLLGLQDVYRIEKARILGRNGTQFTFHGLKHNVQEIKSLEGADICWVEEAASVSKGSWDVLTPTIRKEGSELWITFNPVLDTDESYRRWVINPPPGSKVVKIGYEDNPWLSDTLRAEIEHDRATNPDKYNHVWGGCCISMLEGAIYAHEMREVDREGRIRQVPYDRSRPVDCFWDLGYGDMTAIWFAQALPMEYRLIDYLEGSGHGIQWYLQQMQSRGYIYGADYLPWDIGMHAGKMGNGRSIEELMRQAGRKVRITPKLSVADGINAARTIFPQCWFDAEKCADGIQALRHYRYGEMKTLEHPTREPLHDWASHSADSFRYYAVNIREPQRQKAKVQQQMRPVSAWG
jgi:phage terminase large subunit